MAGRALTIDINTRDAQTLAALKRIQRELGQVDKATEQTGRKSLGLKDALGGLAVGAGLKMAVGEFEEAQKSAAQTTAVIRSTGNAAQVSARQQEDMVASLSKLAAVDDEVVNGGANMLRTFTEVKDQAFEPALKSALDLSAAMGTDLQSATVMLGKALNNPAAGLAKLTRAGVMFTAQQKAQVKALQESGDILGAQKIILDEVQKEFGGSAEANATSSARMKVAFGDAAESLGESLVPALEAGAKAATVASDAFQALPGPLRTVIAGGAGAALVANSIVSGYQKIAPTFQRVGSAAKGMGSDILGTKNAMSSFNVESGEAGETTKSTSQKIGGAVAGVSALTGAVVVGAEAWQQWGQQGRDAAGGWIDQFNQKNGQTIEGLRETAREAKAFAEGISHDDSNMAKPFFGLFDIDADRATAEAKSVAEAQAAAYEEGAKRIEEVAAATGLSTSQVAERLAGLGLSAVTSDTESLTAAIEKSGGAQAVQAEETAKATDEYKKQTDAARSLFDAQQGVDAAHRSVAESVEGVAAAQAGVTDAEHALADAHRGVADAARGVRDAERSLADARGAEADAASVLADAQRAAAGGARELEDANQGVADAEKALAQAQRDSKSAQEDLTRARSDAVEKLDDLGRAAEGAALSEASARLSLKEAKQRLAELGKDGKEVSATDRERAALAVKQAELGIRDAIDRSQEATVEYTEAQRKGIEGSDEVVAAKDRIAEAAAKEVEAHDRVTAAQQHVADVQQALADKVVEAQKRVEDAHRQVEDASLRVVDAQRSVHEAQQRVSDAAEGVVEARGQVAAAEEKVTDALLGQIDAQAVLDAMRVGASGATRQQIDRYRELAATLEPGSPLRRHLAELADALENVSGTYDINLAIKTLGDAPPGAVNAERQGRASGGPTRAGVEYRVNESNQEFFSADRDGYVYPSRTSYEQAVAARAARRPAGDGTGAKVTVNVVAPAGQDPAAWGGVVGREAARELRRVGRY